MTLLDVLNLMDDEVWVRVRVYNGRENDPEDDLVLWAADWIGGGRTDPGMPDGLDNYLEWDADDLFVEMHADPELRGARGRANIMVPMIVVNAYPPSEVT